MEDHIASRDLSHAGGVKLDTSGFVPDISPSAPRVNGEPCAYSWEALPNDFVRGYIEALFASLSVDVLGQWLDTVDPFRKPAFSDLAPEALAWIIADCGYARGGSGAPGPDTRENGASFWFVRNHHQRFLAKVHGDRFPPLTATLGDDGRVYLRERA